MGIYDCSVYLNKKNITLLKINDYNNVIFYLSLENNNFACSVPVR